MTRLGIVCFALLASSVAWPGSALAQERFTCTEVLGFSQSLQWYRGTADGRGQPGGRMGRPPGDFLPGWQARFTGGAAVELWTDSDYPGWTGTSVSESRCEQTKVDRVLFQVSGAPKEVDEWVADIRKVVALIQQKYPGVREILLMPVVGAPEGQCQNVRAGSNYPTIVEAISKVAGEGIVRAGAAPVVADCSWFLDRLGHLTADAAAAIKQQLQDHYLEVQRQGKPPCESESPPPQPPSSL
jgi:hypothetical protein